LVLILYWSCILYTNYWYWIFNTLIAVTVSFGISLVTYYLLICFFGITTLFGMDPLLLCAIIPIKVYSNAEADKDKILKENKNQSGIYM